MSSSFGVRAITISASSASASSSIYGFVPSPCITFNLFTSASSRVIEQNAFIEEMTSVVSIADGRIKIIQIKIDNGDCSVNKKLWELEFPRDTIVACIMRGQDTIIPRGDTRIISGDIAVAISSHHDESEIIKELKGSQKNA